MLNALLIFAMQLIIVPLTTLRTTFIVKGMRKQASLVGLIESFIYVIALGVIFSDLSNIYNMIAYATGYASGLMLGGIVEQKLAIGYRLVNIYLLDENTDLEEKLRQEGFGVTTYEGQGINDESRYRLDILVNRKREKELLALIEAEAPKAFVLNFEPTFFKGGYVLQRHELPQSPKKKSTSISDESTDEKSEK